MTQSPCCVLRLLQNCVVSSPSMARAIALLWYWGMLVEMVLAAVASSPAVA